MLIMPSFKKSLIVEQFLGNYLKGTLTNNCGEQRNFSIGNKREEMKFSKDQENKLLPVGFKELHSLEISENFVDQ